MTGAGGGGDGALYGGPGSSPPGGDGDVQYHGGGAAASGGEQSNTKPHEVTDATRAKLSSNERSISEGDVVEGAQGSAKRSSRRFKFEMRQAAGETVLAS